MTTKIGKLCAGCEKPLCVSSEHKAPGIKVWCFACCFAGRDVEAAS